MVSQPRVVFVTILRQGRVVLPLWDHEKNAVPYGVPSPLADIRKWMEDAGWEVVPLDYMKLEKADESWRPGEISDSFPNCSGGIKACCGYE